MIQEKIVCKYDCVVVAVAHQQYRVLSEEHFINITMSDTLLADIKGIYLNQIYTLKHWSL